MSCHCAGVRPNPHCPTHGTGTGMSHFEFTELNNLVLKKGGTVAAPRSKTNAPYTAPKDLPNGFYGLGELTAQEALGLAGIGLAQTVFLAGAFAVGGMFSAWNQEFFIGNKRNLSYKTIAKRNAILGAAVGVITTGAMGYLLVQD